LFSAIGHSHSAETRHIQTQSRHIQSMAGMLPGARIHLHHQSEIKQPLENKRETL
jgi:hypothetical protein